jgi:hypothetical protein
MQAPLKASGWWNYKIPPMLAVAYFALASAPRALDSSRVELYIALYLVAVVGMAGFGHVLLDAFDVEEDRLLGKANLWAPLSPAGRITVIVLLLAASWLPWLVLPAGKTGIALVTLEFVFFALYAVPPIRLKERGFPGIVADSMYAHVLPALWTWIPFSVISGARVPSWFPIAMGIWALFVGMRHLLQHQVIQIDSDRSANARTHAVRRGREATLSLIVTKVLPLEMLSFIAMALAMASHAPAVAVGFVAYLSWQAFKLRFIWLAKFNIVGSMQQAERSTVVGTLVMSRFYERWLPLLLLGTLAYRQPAFLPLLLLHLLVFQDAIVEVMREDLPLAVSFGRARSARPADGVHSSLHDTQAA